MKHQPTNLLLPLLFLACTVGARAQTRHYTTANAHSHNDYEHSLPFYDAYARHFGSIEADVWATPNTARAYRMLMHLGVDYIGTDSLTKLEFLLRGEGQ